jgi:hypothetical protein
MGRFVVGLLLLALALLLGFASSPSYGMLLTVAMVASAGAAYFFWTAGLGRALPLRIGTWAGTALAAMNVLQALLRLLFQFRPTDLLTRTAS